MTTAEEKPYKTKYHNYEPLFLGADRAMIQFRDFQVYGNPPKVVAEAVSKYANNSYMNQVAHGHERKTVLVTRDAAIKLYPYIAAEVTPINSQTQTSGRVHHTYWLNHKA